MYFQRVRRVLPASTEEDNPQGESLDKRHIRSNKVAAPAINTRQHSQDQQTKIHASPINIRTQLHWDYSRHQSVAVKTVETAGSAPFEEDLVRRLVAYEVASMDRTIPHPNVVRLLEVSRASPSGASLVMEADAVCLGDLMQTISSAPEGR